MKKLLPLFYTALFGVAGVAHFATPDFFLQAMPPFLPFPVALNYIVGALEIGLAIGFWTKYCTQTCWIAFLLLGAFLSVHIWHIQIGKFPSLPALPAYVLWIRVFIQFGLMAGLWYLAKDKTK
jgi:uncharacterized membrane protein